MLRISSIGVIILTIACSRGSDSSENKNIFGDDNRQQADVAKDPFKSIGRLDNGCTGTLIGKRLVLTAAHCIVDEKGAIQSTLANFKPGLTNGNSSTQAWIVEAWIGTKTPEQDRLNDWAIVKISAPLGEQFTPITLGSQTIADNQLPYKVSLAGYSGDFQEGKTQSVHHDCTIKERVQERMLHDCDSATGISGAALISFVTGKPEIVGISVSEYRNGSQNSVHVDAYSRDSANVAIAVDRAKAVATQLLAYDAQGNFPDTATNALYLKNPTTDPNPVGEPGGTPGNNPVVTPGGTPGNNPVVTPGGTPGNNPVVTPGGIPISPKSCLSNGLQSNTVYREYDLKPGAIIYERSTPLYTEASNVAIKAKRLLQIFREAQRFQEFNMSFAVQDGALRLQDLMARAETNGFGSAQLYDTYAHMCAGTYALSQSFQTSPWTVEPGLVQDLKVSIANLENLLFL